MKVSSSLALDSGPARSPYVSAENRCCCPGRPGDPASTCCAQACFRDAVNDSIAGAHYADIGLSSLARSLKEKKRLT